MKKNYILIGEKSPKFHEKIKKKTIDLINEKLFKLDKKTKKKPIIYYFIGDEKPLKPS